MPEIASSIRGNVLIARMKFLQQRGGPEAVKRVFARLTPGEVDVLSRPLLPVVWYPMELGNRFDAAIAAELGRGDPARLFKEMGRASAEANLQGAEKILLKPGDPQHLLRIAPSVYALYYKVGRRTYESTGPTSGVLRTFEADSVTANDCLTVMGWYERGIELSGGLNPSSSHPRCRAKGAPLCEYLFEWTMPPHADSSR